MNKAFQYIILGVVFAFISCEKVIDIDLDSAEPQLVIEGVIRDGIGQNHVKLSMSQPVYDDTDFDVISDATVRVTDKDGLVYEFIEQDTLPGTYICPTLTALPQNHYSLEIICSKGIYTSQSTTFKKPKIDSLRFDDQGFGLSEFLGYVPIITYYYSTDPADETNFYECHIWVNELKNTTLYFGNDEFINGQHYNAPFLGDFAQNGDTVSVSIQACDEDYYTYLFSFANQDDGSPFSAAPSNPVSNIEGENVVGYFAAFTTDTLQVIIPE